MPNIDVNQPGSFCWFELATSDTAAAKAFYQKLFGWTSVEFPMGPNEGDVYTVFQKNGRDAGACHPLMEDLKKMGVPPHWLLYVAVENVDESVRRAVELGATVRAEPFDVMEMGRMAVLADPQGASLALWQAKSNQGIGISNEPGTFTWAELWSRDVPASKAFYGKLFGWTMDVMQMGELAYEVISLGERQIGGIYKMPDDMQAPPNWSAYWEVADCDATAAAAEAAGAKLLMPITTLEQVGRFVALTDPQGAMLSVITSEPR